MNNATRLAIYGSQAEWVTDYSNHILTPRMFISFLFYDKYKSDANEEMLQGAIGCSNFCDRKVLLDAVSCLA